MFKKVTLCLLCLVMLVSSAFAEGRSTLRVIGQLYDADHYPGAEIELLDASDTMNEIANAIATHNDQIDLFVFSSFEGLYSVKKHDYFTPLNDSEVLMDRLDDLYPAFRTALTTEDGRLVGWPIGATVMGMMLYQTTVLQDNGMTPPETFEEMIDQCLALLEADVLPSGTALLSEMPFTRECVLDLYMDQYVRASQLEGGVVNFLDPAFAAMAERIRNEVPENDPAFENGYPDTGVFAYPIGFDYLDEDMLPMPQVAAGKAGLVDTDMTIAVVNPYSKNREAAVAFLEWYSAQVNQGTYIYDASLGLIENENNVAEIEALQARIDLLEAVEEPTFEQQDQLDGLRRQLESMERYRYIVSPETLAAYAQMSDGLSVAEASPVNYDNDQALRTAAQRFLNGAFGAQTFAKECQNHITMIYQENGIPMN